LGIVTVPVGIVVGAAVIGDTVTSVGDAVGLKVGANVEPDVGRADGDDAGTEVGINVVAPPHTSSTATPKQGAQFMVPATLQPRQGSMNCDPS
jgi:hypothetical protein